MHIRNILIQIKHSNKYETVILFERLKIGKYSFKQLPYVLPYVHFSLYR
jgi:hypothetical protein